MICHGRDKDLIWEDGIDLPAISDQIVEWFEELVREPSREEVLLAHLPRYGHQVGGEVALVTVGLVHQVVVSFGPG